jgi:hypothetical protein
MEVSSQFHTSAALYLEKELPIHTEQEAGWAPEPIWTLVESILAAPDCLGHDLAIVPSLLSWLPCSIFSK